jgi:hypothetical protein
LEANRLTTGIRSTTANSAVARASPYLTLTRPWDGIGDWLFSLAVLKFVQRQRPEVGLFVDFRALRARAGLPPLVRQLYDESDVRFTHGICPREGMVTHDSLVYRKYPPVLYLESTVAHLNDQTGLGIRYEPGVFPVFRSAASVTQRGDYVVMVSQGKRRDRYRKEWGYANFAALALMLARAGVTLVQLGRSGDGHLPGVRSRVMGEHASSVVRLLAGARAFVGIENGLMVLAGYLGVPQVTIYDGAPNADRVDFAGQAKITGRTEPPEAAAAIKNWLQSGSL